MTIADYTPLCDVKGCNEPQCGEIFELNWIPRSQDDPKIVKILNFRVHPCCQHFDLLRG